jgi:predicted RNase H-like nuclease (RuvC/YqgF family)
MEPDSVNLDSDPILDQQINQLKIKIQRMQEENKCLDEKIESTNENISTYISEMSSMIDS